MNKKRMIKTLVPMMTVVMMAVAACAQNEQEGRGQQGPPPEAIKACEGKAVGDIVSFSGRRGESVKATCQTVENQIVAVPEGHRPQQ
ncbi:hypothetical protein [Desulforhopalus sp. 52FAK]